MLKSYEPKKNTVITTNMLLVLANEQQSRRIRRRNITDINKIESIRLEYLNILNIDCLWPLKNLVKLKLNNNVIEKIENLETLEHLCELDLSFNRIKKIENLEALKNIHVLSFYNNQIKIVEGIDHMVNLSILSFGKNNIVDLDHVLYFRRFKELRSLQMTGNPCTETSGYITYLIAFIPQLTYYGYKMITEQERTDAFEKHCRILDNVLEDEIRREKEIQAKKEKAAKTAQLSISYVEYLNDDLLFEQMFEQDEEGVQVAKFNEDTLEVYNQYKKNFSDVCHQLYEVGLKEENRRREEIQALNSVVDDLLTTVMNRARNIMESVQGKRVEITVRVTQMLRETAVAADFAHVGDEAVDEIDKLARQLSQEFNEYAHSVWTKLMREETIVHEQIEEMSNIFEVNIADMVSSFLEAAQDYFTQMRSLETEYFETISPLAMSHVNSLEDDGKAKTPFLASLIEEKEALNNSTAGSHFTHMQVIDDRQDRMIGRLKDWEAKFVRNLMDDETARSRNRILEITHFLNYHRDNATVSKLLGQQSHELEEEEEEQDNAEEEARETSEETVTPSEDD